VRSDSFIRARRLADHFPPDQESSIACLAKAYEYGRPAAWNALMTPKHQVKDSDRQRMGEMANSVPTHIKAQKAHERLKIILESAAAMAVSPEDIIVDPRKDYAQLNGRLARLAKINKIDPDLFETTENEALEYATLITESLRCSLKFALGILGPVPHLIINEAKLRTMMGLAKYNIFSMEQKRHIAVGILVAFMNEIWEASTRFGQQGNSLMTCELVQFHKHLSNTAAMIAHASDTQAHDSHCALAPERE
jgi:hypothetical protein